MMTPKIYVIVPVFNEASVLTQTLDGLTSCGYKIILVDDGSSDDTEKIASKYSLLFLRHVLNIGQGAALRTGMLAAEHLGADIIVHFDADGQHDAFDIDKLIKPLLQDQYDIVFGSRFLRPEDKSAIPRFRRFTLQIARYVNWIFYGILLSDAHNGFRAMNRKAFEKMTFTQNRMGHASEILHIVQKNHLRFAEIPVTIRYTQYSQNKGQGIFDSVTILFDLILKSIQK